MKADWPWVLIVTILILMLINEIGYRFGRRSAEKANADQKATASVLVGAILGLLGLLLAFSFGIVEARFSDRKALVLEDANAIGTAFLRAKTIPEPYGARVRRLLTEYADLRLAPKDPEALQEALLESPKLQKRMWTEMAALAEKAPESPIVALFEDALNHMIDLHESRVTVGFYQRLPLPILVTLYAVSMLGLLVLGYVSGLGLSRLLAGTMTLVLAISSVVMLIVELDHPSSKLFQVSQQAMADTHQMMIEDQAPHDRALSLRRRSRPRTTLENGPGRWGRSGSRGPWSPGPPEGPSRGGVRPSPEDVDARKPRASFLPANPLG